MKRVWLICLFFLAASPAEPSDDQRVLRALAANRSLLERFESEYATLKEMESSHVPLVKTEMRKLHYKIRALSEDGERLESLLSENEQAGQFLSEVVQKADQGAYRPKVEAAKMGMREELYALHEKALKLVSQKRFLDAAKIYEEIILTDPDDDQAYIILGHIFILTGRYDRAQESFQSAVQIDPENVHQITPFYENMILRDPEDDQAHANLGYAYLILGDPLRARDAFADALSINPSNETALDGLGILGRGNS